MNRAKRIANESNELIKKLILILIVQAIIFAAPTSAQQNRFVLRGEVKDQQGAVIVNAEIALSGENDAEQETVSDKQGAFRFERLRNGNYTLRISAAGFAEHEENLELSATARPSEVSIVLYPTIRADVEVKDNAEIALDAERAAGTQILTEKELEDLPDDPDRLLGQLQNLAASAGGAPGGAIVTVDGFSGGRLPPKSAIRQVRINPNLYSAEYDTPPFRGGRAAGARPRLRRPPGPWSGRRR